MCIYSKSVEVCFCEWKAPWGACVRVLFKSNDIVLGIEGKCERKFLLVCTLVEHLLSVQKVFNKNAWRIWSKRLAWNFSYMLRKYYDLRTYKIESLLYILYTALFHFYFLSYFVYAQVFLKYLIQSALLILYAFSHIIEIIILTVTLLQYNNLIIIIL